VARGVDVIGADAAVSTGGPVGVERTPPIGEPKTRSVKQVDDARTVWSVDVRHVGFPRVTRQKTLGLSGGHRA
jgi:hypothetical protein